VRRQAATIFRRHIVAARNGEFLPQAIDLRAGATNPEPWATTAQGTNN
jgi:hypothetical protein